ncbi:MAG: penicillin acylase family protein [Saprospiraceae bacterium]|nr:penicillin acylase family protein [Saprospiraceae bacterium]
MRILKLLFSLLLTGAVVWLLQTTHKIGDSSLPPLGAFFNPFSGFWKNAEPAKGFLFHNAKLKGLSGSVEVVYDDMLVPHIFAENMADAVRVQGYVTAQHRLWQMDISTRKSAGRLSEILGERTLQIDRMARRRGMVFAAENAVLSWSKSAEGMRLLQAYTEGVNAYVEGLSAAEYPIEFKLLNYKPEPWSVLKTALLVEAMAETLAAGENDLASTNALALFGRDTFNYLYPEWNPKQQAIVPDTGQWRDWQVTLPPVAAPEPSGLLSGISEGAKFKFSLDERTDPYDDYIVGSNNWAVAGSNTASGHPLLCNDPHLNLTLPSIWFQLQIHTPEQNCYGVSLQGLPGMIIGFNEEVAWGVTNVGHDVSDWYKIAWVDNERTQYKLDAETREVQKRVETIKIKGKEPFLDTVRYTVWGPVVYDYEPTHPLRDCALRWLTHDQPSRDEMNTFLFLNAGKNYDDYRRALAAYDCPAQNFVFATRSGDIAITVQGRFPVRAPQQGRFVQDGSRWSNAWLDYIPTERVPAMKNPARGFVYSANQHSTPPTYPYYYLSNDFDDYRGRRIFDRLSSMRAATLDSMKTMQLDNFSQRAADALPVMLRMLDRSKLGAEGLKMADELAAWNYRYDANATAPPLYEVWFDSCYLRTWDEITSLRAEKKQVLMPERWRFIELLEKDPNSIFFDHLTTPQRETAHDIVHQSFALMQQYFKENPDKRTGWGAFRGFAIKHLALIDAFSRLDVVVGGHSSAPNAIKQGNGPSWRMIVELGERVRGLGVYPGGQSGNPGSRYYDNMVDTWAKGEYNNLLFLKSADEPSSQILGRQVFLP